MSDELAVIKRKLAARKGKAGYALNVRELEQRKQQMEAQGGD